jgi:tetratricopeptide (TPR) repeat protein
MNEKREFTIRNLCVYFFGILICMHSLAEVDDFVCGSLQNAYGPFDYRSDKDKLAIVESYHLTPNVVNLVSTQSAGTIGGDLDYTLRAFPNHHRALMAMMKLGEKENAAKPRGAKYGVECYFQRALRFRDDDATVRMIYASYLSKKGKRVEALGQLDAAERLESENANIIYNTGLIYFDLKEYDKSLSYARRAYGLGFPLPGLRDKLRRAGKWKDIGE